MSAWEAFKKRHPWIQEVLSRVQVRKYAATGDAARILAALEEEEQLLGTMNYYASLVKNTIEEINSDIERIRDEIGIISKFRQELAAIENTLDRAIMQLRALRKTHVVKRVADNYIIQNVERDIPALAGMYSQTKTFPETERRIEYLKKQIYDAMEIMDWARARYEESKQGEEKSGGEKTE